MIHPVAINHTYVYNLFSSLLEKCSLFLESIFDRILFSCFGESEDAILLILWLKLLKNFWRSLSPLSQLWRYFLLGLWFRGRTTVLGTEGLEVSFILVSDLSRPIYLRVNHNFYFILINKVVFKTCSEKI